MLFCLWVYTLSESIVGDFSRINVHVFNLSKYPNEYTLKYIFLQFLSAPLVSLIKVYLFTSMLGVESFVASSEWCMWSDEW